MRQMSRVLALMALLLTAPLAFAQQPSEAQVDRLLEVMRARQTVETMLPQVQASQQQMVAQLTAGEELGKEERARLDAVVARSNQRIAETLTWDKLEPLYSDIYAQTFSPEDVDAMIEFYASPAGQKLLDKMPQLMQNTMVAVQQLVMPMLQQLEQDIRELDATK
ncbi:DUF2059 domain-containing protein [Luteimonas sp. RD2P54]|uniref:DUF2059 domain-containing protein n=1 Tax=Luteimonas endophytica TaxID=3042023 RepID=A0ABT6J6T8_9GAMM|nr:DUF2059 domain-containing protein [Luteimonas endophytica]MDH5822469.1 DUF2059 domain-containing protein [Luteimonas endophytica]